MNTVQIDLLKTKIGNKITIAKYNDFGFLSQTKCLLEDVKVGKYAQYNNAVFIIFKPKGKRKSYQIIYKGYEDILIYSGHVDLKTDMFVSTTTTEEVTVRQSLMCFDNAYIDIAAKSTTENPLIFIKKD